MAIMKAPKDCSSVTTSDRKTYTVENGFIDATGASGRALAEIVAHGFTPATDEEIAAADKAEVLDSQVVQHVKRTRNQILATLKERGNVEYDGRAPTAQLEQKMIESDQLLAEKEKAEAEAEEAERLAAEKKAAESGQG